MMAIAQKENCSGAEQSKDRPGGADGDRTRERIAEQAAVQAADHKDGQEAQVPDVPFQQRSQRVERVQVEEQVHDAAVEKDGGQKPPELARSDQLVDLGPQQDQHTEIGARERGPGSKEPEAEQHGDDKEGQKDTQQPARDEGAAQTNVKLWHFLG